MELIGCSYKNDAFIIDLEYTGAGGELQFFLGSDVHFDSMACQREKYFSDVKRVVDMGGYVLDFGDYLDVMGGKYDPRSTYSDIRPEYKKINYFDAVLNDAIEKNPFWDRYLFMAEGNHEYEVQKRHHTHLHSRLIDRLLMQKGLTVRYGKYSGWIVFRVSYFSNGASGRRKATRIIRTMKYTHGSGGNAPVTKGAIQSARRQDQYQADFHVSGHIHTEYNIPRPVAFLGSTYKEKIKNVRHIQLGTYSLSHQSYYAQKKGFAIPVIGGSIMRVRASRNVELDSRDIEVSFESTAY